MMDFVILVNSRSAHQLPLAREIVRQLGHERVRFVYTSERELGNQIIDVAESWVTRDDSFVDSAKVLLSGVRDVDLFERRSSKGLISCYMSERWFKPAIGILRLLSPRYLSMARRFVRLMRTDTFQYLPIGLHAARDMARLCGLFGGDLRCLFRAPKLEFERRPGGKVLLKSEPRNTRSTRKYCLDKMRMWGYFVEPSKFTGQNSQAENADDNSTTPTKNLKLKTLRVLWVGRLLKLKRVDTIIRAVGELSRSPSNSNLQLQLDIYGTGPEEAKLKRLSAKYGDIINFYPPVAIDEVRKLMQEHDVYVLSSNAYEGWGAVVSEALEEGMKVIGTYEAGSSSTILPKERLFHSGDWKGLMPLLGKDILQVDIGPWTARAAANALRLCGLYE